MVDAVTKSAPTEQTKLGSYSYSSMRTGFAARARELAQLVQAALRPVGPGVDATLATVRTTESRVLEHTGLRLEKLRTLEIGPGQCPHRLRIMSFKNDAVGIDTDVIPQDMNLAAYVTMIRQSPPMRTLKTLGRKALARDARADAVLAAKLGTKRLPPLKTLRMSATQMSFPDASFDFVSSYSVFEHIDDPAAAVREVRRVLRPGGVAYISLHLYTSHSGQHDPVICNTGTPTPPLWPHLRPEYEHTVHPAAYLNRVRLEEWRRMFSEVMPGVAFLTERQDHEIGDGLAKLREAGELAGYTDEELMTVNLVAIWKKS
jgi:SAM-dependent methyltransferase